MPPVPSPPALPRIITYYQTHHTHDGQSISALPLLTQPGIRLTHLILAAIHVNGDPHAITLNDHPPSHPRFHTLWAEMRILQASGVRVLGMLGGAAKGTFAVDRLGSDDDAVFERYYAPLRDLVRARSLDGLDLDVEEEMSLGAAVRLVDRLRADFGPHFIITFAPVAAALLNSRNNLSGFDYEALEVMRGHEIAWYNCQFCEFGPNLFHFLLTSSPASPGVVHKCFLCRDLIATRQQTTTLGSLTMARLRMGRLLQPHHVRDAPHERLGTRKGRRWPGDKPR